MNSVSKNSVTSSAERHGRPKHVFSHIADADVARRQIGVLKAEAGQLPVPGLGEVEAAISKSKCPTAMLSVGH